MAHFVRSLVPAIGIALPIAACGGTVHDERQSDGGTGGSRTDEHSIPATGAYPGAGGLVANGGRIGSGGTTIPGGGWTAAGGTTVASGGWTASGGTTVASGGALPVAGAPGCCLAQATCPPGEAPLTGPDACSHSGCHAVAACCTTVWCDPGPCVLSCSPGQSLEPGPCRTPFSCTTHTVCGITYGCYWPLDGGVADSAPPPDCPPPGVHVVAEDPVCARIDPTCPAQTTYYHGACGCGCEQDAGCPASVDCAPKVPPVPRSTLCSDTTTCPYTVRAF